VEVRGCRMGRDGMRCVEMGSQKKHVRGEFLAGCSCLKGMLDSVFDYFIQQID
jgi:hypothetical protein